MSIETPEPIEVPRELWSTILPGSRVRIEDERGATIQGVLGGKGGSGWRIGDSYYVDRSHATAVLLIAPPADPDADLVQAVADAIEPLLVEGKVVAQTHAAHFRDVARAALAVVREREAAR